MIIFKTDNYRLARDLARVYADNDYEVYTDGKSAVLIYEAGKPYGGEMKLFSGSNEVSIDVLSVIARIILGKEVEETDD